MSQSAETRSDDDAPGLSRYVIVAGVAAATMGLELAQTRILSVIYYNHVVYLTVTIALMGFGVSGVLVSVLGRRAASVEKWTGVALAGFALSSFACIGAASFVVRWFASDQVWQKILLSYLVLVLPFLFAGASLALIFRRHGAHIFKLYFGDLVASAAAAVLFALLLRPLGATLFVWLASGVALGAFLLHQNGAVGGRRRAAALGVVVAWALSALVLGPDLVNVRPETYKILGKYFDAGHGESDVEASAWTPVAKIDVFPFVVDPEGYDLGLPPEEIPKRITQDGDATTVIMGPREVREMIARIGEGAIERAPGLALAVREPLDEVLVIGVGGGYDIVQAHGFGAGHITGIEINPATVDFLANRYRDFARWPTWPNVDLVEAEGRHYVRTSGRTFDVIVMSAVDTFAALNSGAYVLSENYLYTTEAIADYLGALRPGGIVAIYRWLAYQPRESLRLANLVLEAGRNMGLADPARSLIVVAERNSARQWSSATLFKATPFTSEEIATIAAGVAASDHLGILYAPGIDDSDRFPESLNAARAAFAGLIEASTRAEREHFVETYAFNVAPVFDDRPFFFEYHKLSNLFGGGGAMTLVQRGNIVHYALYYLLLITVWASLVAMIVPLAIFEREGLRAPRMRSLLAYFCSLGVGFMLIEIGVMQRLSLYLGHPVYSLTVVLAGLLLFAGLGSYVAGQLRRSHAVLAQVGTAASAVAMIVWLGAMELVLPATTGWPFPARVAVVLASLLPLGLAMGFPFATGLNYLESRYPRFIPWAWGINGLTSVTASILAIILAMRFGFTVVLILGSAVYVLGFLAIRLHMAPAAEGDARD